MMRRLFITPALLVAGLAVATVPAIALRLTQPAADMKVPLTVISTDPFTNSTSQHETEVEPDTIAWGSTIVSVFQQGRYYTGGGASDIGWATSTDGGTTWTHGSFKGITKTENSKNPYQRASDPAVAYDALHGRWLAVVLPINNSTGLVPVVVGSSNGLKWDKPVKIAADNGDFIDKSWIVCDNGASSKYYGHCYVEDDDATLGDQELMSTSADGGKTWSTPYAVPNVFGLGGQPLAQPNGTAVVPHVSVNGTINAFSSTNGGKTWGNDVTIAPINFNPIGGSLRASVLPSADEDGAGNIYVAWPDCSFRASCTRNDIVYVTSPDGQNWSAVQRVPIDSVNSSADHFIPGIAVDPATAGKKAHVALTYYFYPHASCSSVCNLTVGYIASTNGGATWVKAKKVSSVMQTPWFANTDQGYMVGDYISTSYVGGMVHGAFAVADAPSGSVFDEVTATTAAGLPAIREPFETTARGEHQVSRRPYHIPFKPAIL
jgi:hypothetical protein